MKNIILFITCFFAIIQFIHGQERTFETIVNNKSNQHQNVLNSKIFLIFPEGFKNLDNFVGITNGNEVIQVFDVNTWSTFPTPFID